MYNRGLHCETLSLNVQYHYSSFEQMAQCGKVSMVEEVALCLPGRYRSRLSSRGMRTRPANQHSWQTSQDRGDLNTRCADMRSQVRQSDTSDCGKAEQRWRWLRGTVGRDATGG